MWWAEVATIFICHYHHTCILVIISKTYTGAVPILGGVSPSTSLISNVVNNTTSINSLLIRYYMGVVIIPVIHKYLGFLETCRNTV